MARGGLFICDQVMLEQELKEVGRKSHSYLGKSTPGRGRCTCKVLRRVCAAQDIRVTNEGTASESFRNFDGPFKNTTVIYNYMNIIK